FFFFSSRRRHTRWPRDWSSDVCSSDLRNRGDRRDRREIFLSAFFSAVFAVFSYRRALAGARAGAGAADVQQGDRADHLAPLCPRSEERRVGKEGRARMWRRPGTEVELG